LEVSVGRELELANLRTDLQRQQDEARRQTSLGSVLSDAFVAPIAKLFGAYENAPAKAQAVGEALWRHDAKVSSEQREVGADYGANISRQLGGALGDVTGVGAAATVRLGQTALEAELGGRAIRTAEEVAAARRAQLAVNSTKGREFEKEVVAAVKSSHVDVVEQLTIKTRSGARTRIDVAARNPETGAIVLKEAKSSASAPLRRNQKAAFPEVLESGGVVAGQGKPGFPGGTTIPPTGIEIVRPPGVD
jgi:hypothetical protein